MDDLESKLSALMGNPEMMQKIMSFAQSMGTDTPSSPSPPAGDALPDMAMISKLTSLAGNSRIDKKQQNLLNALHPYLSSHRISKLEKAMRAAKMAGMASVFLSSTGR